MGHSVEASTRQSNEDDSNDADNNERDARGLNSALIGSALLSLGKLTLGQETVDRLTPVVQGIQQISNVLPVVEFKDGRIVLGQSATTTTTTTTTSTTTTTTTTPKPKPAVDKAGSNSLDSDSQTSAARLRSCTTPDGGSGYCQDLSSCPALLLNLPNLRQSICFQSLFVPGVCCPASSPSNAVESFLHQLTSTTRRPVTTIRTEEPTTQRPFTSPPEPVVPVTKPVSVSRPSITSLFKPTSTQSRGKCTL